MGESTKTKNNKMDNARKQLVEKVQSANHILVTVSNNPSVDQLAACIGLTLLLNKLGKHGTAVFSGEVPSTLEFLQPENTIEKNTDSLRDFIIALDKNKADKLRYKVEDDVVRIFITPYKTSITSEDLDFSQGDFNVDVVIALGVNQQDDLDQAITAHGRILHDATVATVNIANEGSLGSINWNDPGASSLSELVTELAQTLGTDLLDEQVATALLTGIVAETARFSNEKTTPQTMSLSAALMSAGANQQLVASKLEEPAPQPKAESEQTESNLDESADQNSGEETTHDEAGSGDGNSELDISHSEETESEVSIEKPVEAPVLEFDSKAFETDESNSEQAVLPPVVEDDPVNTELVTEPPALGGQLTANTEPEALDPATDPLTMILPEAPELLSHDQAAPLPSLPLTPDVLPEIEEPTPAPAPRSPVLTGFTPPPPAWVPPNDNPLDLQPVAPETNDEQTLSDIEAAVKVDDDVDVARDEVTRALSGETSLAPAPEPVTESDSKPFLDSINASEDAGSSPSAMDVETPSVLPEVELPTPTVTDPNAPPPVPPPIPFNFGSTPPPAA